jgi:predicted transposase/invertase (TIGR01784 family)
VQTDSLFYQLFQNCPSVVFELLGDSSPRSSTYSFSSQEVKQTSFRIDGILVPPIYAIDLPIYFVEIQGYRDTQGNLYPGFFSEIFLYLNDYRPVNDWRAVLIFTKKRLDTGISIQYREFANNPRLQRIYLDELTQNVAEGSLELGVLKLIGVKEETAPEQARQLIARTREELTDAAQQRKILELVETVLIYKFPDLSREELEQMLGLNELKQTRFYQEALEEGLEQGRQEGELAVVLRQLRRRLGTVEPQLQLQIQQLSSAQLEELAEALLDFSTAEDLVTWLQTHQPSL